MMMTKNDREMRIRLYRLLSRLYRVEVDAPLLEMLKGLSFPESADETLAEGYAMLRGYLAGCGENALEDLAVDYATVFLAAGSAEGAAAIPCESVYTSAKKIFMQEAWEDVCRLYAEKGMTKTVLFQVSGVKDFDKAGLRIRFAELAKQKLFPYPAQDLFMGSRVGSDNDSLLLNATLIAGNPLDPIERTSMDMELREQIPVIIDWFKKLLPQLSNCSFRSRASRIGVRAGRNLCGRETITQSDLIDNAPVAEPVARGRRSFGGHGISSFNSGANKFTAGSRSIPFGALLSPDADNYYCAGRGISVEVEAITAIRLMICCMATGEAAGCAAALGAEKQEIPAYAALQKVLLSRGAVL